MRTIVAVAAAALAFSQCVAAACAGPTVQHISGKRFEALAKPALAGLSFHGDVSLIPAFPIPDQTVPAGSLMLVRGSALVNPSYVNVPIEIDVNGHFVREVFVGYRVQKYVYTAVAAHDLVPGTVLSSSDVKMARVPFDGQRINGTRALIGRRVLSATRAGQAIPIESTQVNQIVKAGSTIVMIVQDGGVSVVADVVARSSGGLGDEISVYNPQTQKTLSGTVVGPDRVELDLSGAQ